MGNLCEAHCTACGYREVFRLGCGRKDYNIKRIYSHFDLMDVWSIKVIMMEKHLKILYFRYRLGRCRDCGRLHGIPEVVFTDGTSFYAKRCSCQKEKEHEMELLDAENGQTVCPKCNGEIRMKQCGLWD